MSWDDVEDEWTEAIKAAHPTRSGSHEEYATALKMVGNRHSKGELVALVNWLLWRLKATPGAGPETPTPKEPRRGLRSRPLRQQDRPQIHPLVQKSRVR